MNSPPGSATKPARLDRECPVSSLPPDLVKTTSPPSPPSPRSLHDSTPTPTTICVSGDANDSLFSKLPSTVIARILWLVDVNTFASLCILNRKWYQESQIVELFAYHLSRCPSYALSNRVISGPFRKHDLFRLKSKFAVEVRRNLFDAFLQPRRTLIKLISFDANSSAAFPTGEAFRFEFSPNARTLLALSTSRIYVIDATCDLPVVKRHLKTLRRPLSASITDDGSLLAVLSSKHQVNIYGLVPQKVQHLQVVVLDNPPKIIALAHEGTVLAASYEAGIEVFSLAPNSLTTDKRSVRSEAVDTLTFSGDGSMLVGSSLSLEDPNAVVISAPFYTENDPDLSSREIHSRMWTTQILFPQISSVCSHVALLQGHNEGDASWLFAFDHSLMSYRAVRTDDTRAGVAYFISPPGEDRFDTPVPTIAPSASTCGTLAVAAFEGDGLWIYGVPERLDLSPDMGAVVERQNARHDPDNMQLESATGNLEPLMAYSPSCSDSDYFIEEDGLAGKVDWRQSLFVKCRRLQGLSGQTAARWSEPGDDLTSPCGKRLIVVAPGGVSLGEDGLGGEVMPVDGSRMCFLDFRYTPSVCEDRAITIEVGEDEAELLTEHTGTLATEVAMERRRTIRAIPSFGGSRMPLGRSVTSISPPSIPIMEEDLFRGSVSSPSSPVTASGPAGSNAGIQRAATASGFRYALYPPRPPLGSGQQNDQRDSGHVRYASHGRPTSEDSWETPPPPYTGGGSPRHTHHHPYNNFPRIEELPSPQQSPTNMASYQASPGQYRPYRALAANRANNGLNSIMTSHADPTGTMNQYGEMMMAARSRGPSEENSDNIREISWNGPSLPSRISGMASSTPRRHSNLASRTRPISHHGITSPNWPRAIRGTTVPFPSGASTTYIMSPQDHNSVPSGFTEEPSDVNVRGAGMQGYVTHSVSQVSDMPRSFTDPMQFSQSLSNTVGYANRQNMLQPSNGYMQPDFPIADQMVCPRQRMSHAEFRRPPAVENTDFVNRAPVPGGPLSPLKAAWDAQEVPSSRAFGQTLIPPNAFMTSRSDSRNSVAHQASSSAPDLLAVRPNHGRLDNFETTVDPATFNNADATVGSRTHSLSQPTPSQMTEASAYYETSRIGLGSAVAKPGRKQKKKKEESTRKGIRCVVM